MIFEWDISKAELNIKNHGISFIQAEEAFFDDFALDLYDDSHSDAAEQRFQILGMTAKGILWVVYMVVMKKHTALYPLEKRLKRK